MRILGVDPGLASTGTVVIEADCGDLKLLHQELIRTQPDDLLPARLAIISKKIETIIKLHKPEVLAVETAFVRRDTPQSGLSLGKVLGVILLSAYNNGLDIAEITPREVKQSLTGYGNAQKQQIERAVSQWLELDGVLKPTHIADAAAVALTAASILATLRKR